MMNCICHLEEKLTKNASITAKLYEKYDALMEDHIDLHEEHEKRLNELKSKQRILEQHARENQKNYRKNIRDHTK